MKMKAQIQQIQKIIVTKDGTGDGSEEALSRLNFFMFLFVLFIILLV